MGQILSFEVFNRRQLLVENKMAVNGEIFREQKWMVNKVYSEKATKI